MAAYRWVMIGVGGHARVLGELLRCCGIALHAAADPNGGRALAARLGVDAVLSDEDVLDMDPAGTRLVNGIGSVGAAGVRREVYQRFAEQGFVFPGLVHPSAIVPHDVTLAPGCQIMAGAVLQPGAIVGENTIVNTGARVDHDCELGPHVHVAPGATLCGSVTVGAGAHVGAGAVIVQGARVSPGALVRAGSVVVGEFPGTPSAASS